MYTRLGAPRATPGDGCESAPSAALGQPSVRAPRSAIGSSRSDATRPRCERPGQPANLFRRPRGQTKRAQRSAHWELAFDANRQPAALISPRVAPGTESRTVRRRWPEARGRTASSTPGGPDRRDRGLLRREHRRAERARSRLAGLRARAAEEAARARGRRRRPWPSRRARRTRSARAAAPRRVLRRDHLPSLWFAAVVSNMARRPAASPRVVIQGAARCSRGKPRRRAWPPGHRHRSAGAARDAAAAAAALRTSAAIVAAGSGLWPHPASFYGAWRGARRSLARVGPEARRAGRACPCGSRAPRRASPWARRRRSRAALAALALRSWRGGCPAPWRTHPGVPRRLAAGAARRASSRISAGCRGPS